MPKSPLSVLAPSSRPVDPVLAAAGHVILGKDREIRLALTCLLAGGHLLIEDYPGVGKTTLAHALARLLGLQFSRIQFTSDLLEAMEERQVTVEGATRPLPAPFFVIATQNQSHQIGTFPLPESQLDRFLMRIELGYPDHAAERALLAADGLEPLLPVADLPVLQRQAGAVHAAGPLIDYVQALVEATRRDPAFQHGLSPRAGLALLAAARAWAWQDGRDIVVPDDVQEVLPAVARHRLRPAHGSGSARADDIAALVRAVATP